ncbi:MAG: transposase, partial [Hymenobacteraceae bacterium]|nr:transposase [Hymenobacteraceae bacterium]MDX5396197.1 transposase [Hymenobacteraceae bacterium]MDX5443945.1 transposase [Hymenobacteraceae bacterium]MDX5512259.1 transposase [Hymenobacteraceae bacterium]
MEKTVKLEPNKVYHIFTRGNNKENIFRSKENYHYFLQLYRKYISPYVETYAYCLLPNHFHFLIRIKSEEALKPLWLPANSENLISVQRQMAHLLNAYAKAFNNQYNRTDKLFQHRFKRKEVTSEAYFTRLVYYIHFNP